jgi:hypothetical protein
MCVVPMNSIRVLVEWHRGHSAGGSASCAWTLARGTPARREDRRAPDTVRSLLGTAGRDVPKSEHGLRTDGLGRKRRHRLGKMLGIAAWPRTALSSTSVGRALSRVVAEIEEGLRHGYFEYTLTCEIIAHERRRLTLRAGKSHQFVIWKEDCVRWAEQSDSQNGSGEAGVVSTRSRPSRRRHTRSGSPIRDPVAE